MSKNLVLCFEGTSAGFGNPPPSNIIKLFSMLDQNTQTCYYQPGIGTTFGGAVPDIESSTYFKYGLDSIKNSLDAAFALSFESHVQAAYLFLMRFWTPKSKVYIFGFSRGGYTARVLIGFLECFGLFHQGLEMLVPLAWRVYSGWEKAGRPRRDPTSLFLLHLRRLFGQDIRVQFLGIWDTVSLVGILTDRLFPFTTCSSIVDHIRHAQSIDERRAKYRQVPFYVDDHTSDRAVPSLLHRIWIWANSLWFSNHSDTNVSKDILEMWFPGSHGDMGGSWGLDENGKRLSEVPFRWLIAEGCKFGVQLGKDSIESYWERYQPKDSLLLYQHDNLSLRRSKVQEQEIFEGADGVILRCNGRGNSSFLKSIWWWFLELIPFNTKIAKGNGRWTNKFSPNLGKNRVLPPNAQLHWSVFYRLALVDDYRPNNLPPRLGTYIVKLVEETGVSLTEDESASLEALDMESIRTTNLEHIWKRVPDELAHQTGYELMSTA